MPDQPPPPPDPSIPTDGRPPPDTTGYARYFTESAFWQKVTDFAGRIGRGTLQKAMELYTVAASRDTPVWARAIALGSLGYLILPFDAVPDLLPGVGLADDAAALAAAATAILKSITPAVKAKAAEQVNRWLGPDPNAPPTPASDTPPAAG